MDPGQVQLFFNQLVHEDTTGEPTTYCLMFGRWYDRSGTEPTKGTGCESLRYSTRVVGGQTLPWHFFLDVQDINHAAHVVPVYPHNALEYKPGDWKKALKEGIQHFRVNKWAFLGRDYDNN